MREVPVLRRHRSQVLSSAAQSMMGWSDAKMAKRYQHVVAPVQKDAGDRLGRLLWRQGENGN